MRHVEPIQVVDVRFTREYCSAYWLYKGRDPRKSGGVVEKLYNPSDPQLPANRECDVRAGIAHKVRSSGKQRTVEYDVDPGDLFLAAIKRNVEDA